MGGHQGGVGPPSHLWRRFIGAPGVSVLICQPQALKSCASECLSVSPEVLPVSSIAVHWGLAGFPVLFEGLWCVRYKPPATPRAQSGCFFLFCCCLFPAWCFRVRPSWPACSSLREDRTGLTQLRQAGLSHLSRLAFSPNSGRTLQAGFYSLSVSVCVWLAGFPQDSFFACPT